ncbi:uncharacterized protein LOC107227880 [Neodiprion lecontei]|uniref:Uncharacterized protein LOC107227880 n=1 Tax=Neodiprion lecontei TaxID=441921 RepID=A0A6J0CE19_NEOLC|nr:uncharacterized protein LOC107227880 [Neodiprion lecontei]
MVGRQFKKLKGEELGTMKTVIAAELYRQARRNYPRRFVDVHGLDEIWQADLVYMTAHSSCNKGYEYLLTIIDIFSKYAWAVLMKSKSGKDVTAAMKSVLIQSLIPTHLHIDQGEEFYNSEFKALVKHHNINMYATFRNLMASICERSDRTLKNKMWKWSTLQGSYEWINIFNA